MKLGRLVNNEEIPHVYENIFEEITYKNGIKCVLLASSGSIAGIMMELGKYIEGPWFILYVLLTPHTGESGRYQSIQIESYDGVLAFMTKYRDFIDGDGRHNVWIGSTSEHGMLVYDNHNRLFAYGKIDKYVEWLKTRGFKMGTVVIPAPHSHHYHAENAVHERSLLNEWEWKRFPLQDSDDP